MSAVKILDDLLEKCCKLSASDLHIDPFKDRVVFRARIDGALVDFGMCELEQHDALIGRVKVLSGLRTDIHMLAQDGRFSFDMDGDDTDVRVAIAPTFYGENAVLRLLASKARGWTLSDLGFTQDNEDKVLAQISKPCGMILATGPTGSGKTTTLYTLLKKIITPELVAVTLEDPVEYAIEGVRHISVNPDAGFDFAKGLKWIVRQNPDVLLVGEIRDGETARLAVQVSLTGHLLFSSLHTQDASHGLVRLLDLGVESFLVSSTVSCIVGQRLVRRLCEYCKRPAPANTGDLLLFSKYDLSPVEVFVANGCERCFGKGYAGLLGLQEVLVVDEKVQECIGKRLSASEIKRMAILNGMKSLAHDALLKVSEGKTSMQEIWKYLD